MNIYSFFRRRSEGPISKESEFSNLMAKGEAEGVAKAYSMCMSDVDFALRVVTGDTVGPYYRMFRDKLGPAEAMRFKESSPIIDDVINHVLGYQ